MRIKWYILLKNCVRLGQACNHITALFFIEYHVDDEVLPTEILKTSKPMA